MTDGAVDAGERGRRAAPLTVHTQTFRPQLVSCLCPSQPHLPSPTPQPHPPPGAPGPWERGQGRRSGSSEIIPFLLRTRPLPSPGEGPDPGLQPHRCPQPSGDLRPAVTWASVSPVDTPSHRQPPAHLPGDLPASTARPSAQVSLCGRNHCTWAGCTPDPGQGHLAPLFLSGGTGVSHRAYVAQK